MTAMPLDAGRGVKRLAKHTASAINGIMSYGMPTIDTACAPGCAHTSMTTERRISREISACHLLRCDTRATHLGLQIL